MKIRTDYWIPPIPGGEQVAWTAIDQDTYDGAPDSNGYCLIVGRGPTEVDAVKDLCTQMVEWLEDENEKLREARRVEVLEAQQSELRK